MATGASERIYRETNGPARSEQECPIFGIIISTDLKMGKEITAEIRRMFDHVDEIQDQVRNTWRVLQCVRELIPAYHA